LNLARTGHFYFALIVLERGADDLGQPGNDPFDAAGRANDENSTK
jgi:hypothetical protein